jgi:hypothetical protein
MSEPRSEPEEIIPPHESEVIRDSAIARTDNEQSQQIAFSYSSSLLPCSPEQLAELDKVVPGSAQKLLDEFFLQLRHEREMETKLRELDEKELIQNGQLIQSQENIFNSNQARSTLGSKLGFVIALFAIGCATFLGVRGDKAVAIAIVGSIAGVSAIVYGTDALNKNKQKVMEAKNSDEIEENN